MKCKFCGRDMKFWDHAPAWANWYAIDEDGKVFFHEQKPKIIGGSFWNTGKTFFIFEDKNCKYWKESLVKRPEWQGEQNES
mgnify:CR=1 FL=1